MIVITGSKKRKGLVHIYCGDGKGKTTAAIGLMVRSAGYGGRIMLVQFLKNGRSGELAILEKIENISIITGNIFKFTHEMSPEEKLQAALVHEQYLRQAIRAANEDALDLLVLDEVLGAIESGLLPETLLADFLIQKPRSLEVVLTGRKASERIISLADYVSVITAVKHPFMQGIGARRGIEF